MKRWVEQWSRKQKGSLYIILFIISGFMTYMNCRSNHWWWLSDPKIFLFWFFFSFYLLSFDFLTWNKHIWWCTIVRASECTIFCLRITQPKMIRIMSCHCESKSFYHQMKELTHVDFVGFTMKIRHNIVIVKIATKSSLTLLHVHFLPFLYLITCQCLNQMSIYFIPIILLRINWFHSVNQSNVTLTMAICYWISYWIHSK